MDIGLAGKMEKTDLEALFEVLYGSALKGSCMYRKYAALLVSRGEILSAGYAAAAGGRCTACRRNELIRQYGKISEFFEACPVVHAEVCAILNCKTPERIRGSELYLLGILEDGRSIYRRAFPCENCMRIIQYVGISRICVFQSKDSVLCHEVPV